MKNIKMLAAQYAKPGYAVRAMSLKEGLKSLPKNYKKGANVRLLNLLGYMLK
jgi:hypothetical protein